MVKPVTFYEEKEKFIDRMAYYSNLFWVYLGYSGLYSPWHEGLTYKDYLTHIREVRKDKKLVGKKNRFNYLFYDFLKLDVSLQAYSYLILPLRRPEDFQTPFSTFNGLGCMSEVKKLRKHCGSSEGVDLVAKFLAKFFNLQIESYGKISINGYSILKGDRKLGIYYDIFNRINQFNLQGIDYEYWLEKKFNKVKKTFPKEVVNLFTVVNFNKLELLEEELGGGNADSWDEVRDFLDLPIDCEFPDGYIPKGWTPVSPSREIVKVFSNGFYLNRKGEQRCGKSHYMGRSFSILFLIMCNPDNFNKFRKDWNDISLRTRYPTWEEYSNFALKPGFYNEFGEATGRSKPVKVSWRKR